MQAAGRRWRPAWWVMGAVVLVGLGGWGYSARHNGARERAPEVVVYKSPSCGCCAAWVAHMENAGFRVVTHDVANMDSVKERFGVSASLRSCHTATVARYVVEGHVPGDLVSRMLAQAPPITGLAVPGMPGGSPGMEGIAPVPYSVIAFDARGVQSLYESR